MVKKPKTRVIIMGAGGRDFHNFNVVYRNNPNYKVVAFTATQIPNIAGRKYPKELAGKLYPTGIPIYDEKELPELIKKFKADVCVLAYSDLSDEYVMHRASVVNAAGADFEFLGPKKTMLKSKKPVISVTAVRTGSGKSQISRKICEIMLKRGYKIVAIRHPMPYDPDLRIQVCERFETYKDLKKYKCTIEEHEEYEPYIERGMIVYAGVDYEKILRAAEKEADVILWDGGNNDFSFYKPDLNIVVADPHRAGHEISYYPGEINVRMADVIIINKENTAKKESIELVRKNVKEINPNAVIVDANSPFTVEKPELIKGTRVLVVEDGPTVTHGGMSYGAGYFAAKKLNAKIIEPKLYAVGSIKKVFEKFPQLKEILPAMGYGTKQIKELEETINNAKCDVVVSGTPINLNKILKSNKPIVRVRYELQEIGKPNLETILDKFEKKFLR